MEVGFDSPCAFSAGPQDPRRLFMYATEVSFTSVGEAARRTASQKSCRLQGSVIRCEFNATSKTLAQLPILYYPNLMRVSVDGEQRPVEPVEQGPIVASMVEIPAGKSTVTAEFVGSSLGNRFSLVTSLVMIVAILLFWSKFKEKSTPERNGKTATSMT